MHEKITKTVYRCTCDLPDCGKINPAGIDKGGKPRHWDSKDDQIPDRCSWCKRRTWDGQDRRRKETHPDYKWAHVKQCAACGSTEWKNGVCARCKGRPANKTAVKLPKPKRVRALAE